MLGSRIIAETEEYYIAATLGQISDGGYILVIPKAHIPCIGQLTEPGLSCLEPLITRLSKAIATEYSCTPMLFEHGIVGQTIKHAHIHLVPVNHSFTLKIYRDFPNSRIDAVRTWKELVNMHYDDPRPYLLWREQPSMMLNLCHNPPAPAQYLRIILAEIAGRPERANWRNMDPELDKKLWTETVLRLKPHLK